MVNVQVETLELDQLRSGPFDLIASFEVDEENLVYVGFVLREDDEVKAIAYAWNLDSIEEAESADYVELPVIVGTEEEYTIKMLDWLTERYIVAGWVHNDGDEDLFDEQGFIFPKYSDVIGGWVFVREKDAKSVDLINYLTGLENLREVSANENRAAEYRAAYRKLLWNAVPEIRQELPAALQSV